MLTIFKICQVFFTLFRLLQEYSPLFMYIQINLFKSSVLHENSRIFIPIQSKKRRVGYIS